jgi:hypothetical protein
LPRGGVLLRLAAVRRDQRSDIKIAKREMGMARMEDSYPGQNEAAGASLPARVSWAIGLTAFAAVLMTLLGLAHILQGVAAISNGAFYVENPGYVFAADVTTWGWLHILGGIIITLASFWLLVGDPYARVVAVVVAVVSGIGNFLSIPYYPVWSIVLIALDFLIIWAVTSYGRYVSASSSSNRGAPDAET